MELTIDGTRCDLDSGPIAVPGYDLARCADVEACRTGRSLKITLPPTERNDGQLAFARDPHAAEEFNLKRHRALLTACGATLLEGTVRLLAVSEAGYEIEIRDGGAGWAAQAARRMFNTLGVVWSGVLTPTEIVAGWTDDTPVKFFPVCRDSYRQENSGSDLLPAERLLSVDDYHPFLHIATLVEQLFRESGYTVCSRFFESDYFRSLYMSGAYPSHDTAAADSRMGFLARRRGAASAQANEVGRVAANPKAVANTVGNLVETATPLQVDADGEVIDGLFNNGRCFAVEAGKILFRPLTEIRAGFEYYLRYTTAHRIISRTRLRGFDTVYLGPGAEFRFQLANRYPDLRNRMRGGFTYRVLVFDHTPGTAYRLTLTRNGVAGTLWTDFTARSAQITSPVAERISDPVLWVRAGEKWVAYQGDWALYNGYVEETGQTTVEVRLRTPAEQLSPNKPKYFNQIYFGGAEPGMAFTLHKETSLKPRFLSSPGFGMKISFQDVAQLRIRQSVLLEALAHLFNLRFYTEEESRRVWIEPEGEFFGSGPEADWSDRTDFSKPVVRRMIAPQIHEIRGWRYRESEGALRRYDEGRPRPLGAWCFNGRSCAAKIGARILTNPLFSPSVNAVGHYLNAPSASVLAVGDRDRLGEQTNFPTRLVRYMGMVPLPEGERWGYPSDQAAYPLAAFEFAGGGGVEGFTLGFEDRGPLKGLHRYYDRQLEREDRREEISLWIRMAPHEFEALRLPATGACEVRSLFRIDTGAGVVRAQLRAVGDYDPGRGSVHCLFERLTCDG